jgi:hypothetical protein
MPISKIAVASSPYGVGGESGAGLRPASDSELGGHPGDAASLGGTAGLRPASLTGAKRSRLRYRREERARAKLGSRPWPVVGSFVPIQAEQSGVLAATGRACEARQGQAPRGREVRATPTSVTNVTTDTDTVFRLCRNGRWPSRGERGRSPRSPAGGRASGSIRSGTIGFRRGKLSSSWRRSLLPPNPFVVEGVGSL